ncbi:hypothetical protein E6W39_10985 [Kitasatospora acidiphila]|uniref:Uncharacterized protein n=1 Tax=Kitasatospora acidiphila TaxID=2567942 RepID=A0A540W0Z0_9ACTN|nr:hypothetical protein [Kitasatospora acidiphila]TQF02689.1 hypothetical protein E6W39_10985 [Kitasatospora acidiphila]
MSGTEDLRVAFHDYRRPLATAGVYTLTAEHHLTKDGTRVDVNPAIPATTQQFEIRAVRFVLDPSSVHAHYPAEGAVGDFSRTLPHITLDRSILPWERVLKARAVPGQAPWLALMVFQAGELPDDPEGLGQTTTRTIAELRRPGDGILGPDLSDEGITPGIEASRCQSIDVPAGLFTALVPREEELNYLAHVRDVSTRPQLLDDGEVLTEGQYAVLAANRFPRQPGTYTAHLVSLEGFNGKLDPGQLGGSVRSVRLSVLHSWTFTSDPAGTRDAAALLSNLVAPARDDRENLALRLRPSGSVAARSTADAEQYARRRLHLGYTPLPYRLLSGETTYGWYRGPFVPVIAAETRDFARDTPRTTADHALIYEPEHGLFDVSYAAAWTLGRTLALSDPEYSEEMTRARRELANTAATMMALATAGPALAAADPADLDGRTLRELAAPGFASTLLDALARPLAPHDNAPASARRSRRTRLTQQSARAVLAAGPKAAALQATAERHTRTLPAWLDELTLLRRVPFNYLVPHPAMLPPESIRLFRIDENWIEALLAGARDVGVHTSLDALVDTALTAAIDSRRTRIRTGETGRAGLLIRSELVEAWPVFDILTTAGGAHVTELRRDHLAPDTLLLLLDALPDEIVIREPGQGIHFGIDSNDAAGDNSVINLRDHRPGDNLGWPLYRDYAPEGGLLTRHLRLPNGGGAPDVLALRGDRGLVPALARALDPTLSDLAPGEFALQLVNASVKQRLTLDPAPDQESAR